MLLCLSQAENSGQSNSDVNFTLSDLNFSHVSIEPKESETSPRVPGKDVGKVETGKQQQSSYLTSSKPVARYLQLVVAGRRAQNPQPTPN